MQKLCKNYAKIYKRLLNPSYTNICIISRSETRQIIFFNKEKTNNLIRIL